MAAAKHPEQTQIPGTEAPSVPEVEAAIRQWQSAKAEQKHASEALKLKHALLIAHMVTHTLERYPYVDADTGKRRMLVVERDPKAKTKPAPKTPTAKRSKREQRKDIAEHAAEDRDVKPENVPQAKAHSDPFGSARRVVAERDAESP